MFASPLIGNFRPLGPGNRNNRLALPDTLAALYAEADGMYFGNYEIGGGLINVDGIEWYYKLLPLHEVVSISGDGFCDPKSPMIGLIKNWCKFIDYGDGNCLAINLNENGRGEIIDIFHETVGTEGSHNVIAWTLEDWCGLHMASGTHAWWLDMEPLRVY